MFENKFLRRIVNVLTFIGIFGITMFNPLLGSILMLMFAFIFKVINKKAFIIPLIFYLVFVGFYVYPLGILYLIPCLLLLFIYYLMVRGVLWAGLLNGLGIMVYDFVRIATFLLFVSYTREGWETAGELGWGKVMIFFEQSYYLYIVIPYVIYFGVAIILCLVKITLINAENIKAMFLRLLFTVLYSMILFPLLYLIITNLQILIGMAIFIGFIIALFRTNWSEIAQDVKFYDIFGYYPDWGSSVDVGKWGVWQEFLNNRK